MSILIECYNSLWPIMFETEKKLLSQALNDQFLTIEHIGSTAVPGLSAKPIIDILIGIRNLQEVNTPFINALQGLGYIYGEEYIKEWPERRYFRKKLQGIHTHHIHVLEVESIFYKKHILFRDYLRNNKEIALQYEQLKHRLTEGTQSRDAYRKGKSEFIRTVEDLAGA